MKRRQLLRQLWQILGCTLLGHEMTPHGDDDLIVHCHHCPAHVVNPIAIRTLVNEAFKEAWANVRARRGSTPPPAKN